MTVRREVFKPIKGYEGLYEISNFGRVKSLAREWIGGNGCVRKKEITILKPRLKKRGYLSVYLCRNNKHRSYKIAPLVWDIFGNKKRNGMVLQVDHIDGDKQNNWIGNLQLLTNRENISKGYHQNGKKTSKFTGVFWAKEREKWVASIKINGKPKHLGYFINEFDASLVYQKILKEIGGNKVVPPPRLVVMRFFRIGGSRWAPRISGLNKIQQGDTALKIKISSNYIDSVSIDKSKVDIDGFHIVTLRKTQNKIIVKTNCSGIIERHTFLIQRT